MSSKSKKKKKKNWRGCAIVVSGSAGVITDSSHRIMKVIKARTQEIAQTKRNISASNTDR